jgi:hypothetical protein
VIFFLQFAACKTLRLALLYVFLVGDGHMSLELCPVALNVPSAVSLSLEHRGQSTSRENYRICSWSGL